jgi:protoporphyrinogen oxidase
MSMDGTVVLGAGPAGLAAADALAARGLPVEVCEQERQVGGLSRTVEFRGNLLDLGGHRFFTKFTEIEALWREVLGADLLERSRLSRILYRGKLYAYPLRAADALPKLGVFESARCALSYAAARLPGRPRSTTVEDWVSRRFGRRLFEIFFRTYTEKVWGLPCSEIGAAWASQRIRELSLGRAILDALTGRLRRGEVRSLIERFHYPRRGPGMLYERLAGRIGQRGGRVSLGLKVTGLRHEGRRIRAAAGVDEAGRAWERQGTHFVSSIPLPQLVLSLSPAVPAEVRAAAQALTFRHLLTVNLVVDRADLFQDQWIYVHEPGLRVGRIQNFGNWSPEMVAVPGTSVLALEYFTSTGEDLWTADDGALLSMASSEAERSGLLGGARVVEGTVMRVPRAYPVYRIGYEGHLAIVEAYLRQFRNLQLVGRAGLFKYNNADHSILTGLLAAENIAGADHDLWAVNTDTEYHEVRRRTS